MLPQSPIASQSGHTSESVGQDHGAAWLAAMRAGDFTRAWQVNDAVLASRDSATRDDPRVPFHERWVWDGRPVDGARVLVRCYHGLGDTLQFWRYLRPLRARSRHVTVEVQPALIELLQDAPGPDALIPFDPARPSPSAECDIEIMELPHVLRLPPPAMRLPMRRLKAEAPHLEAPGPLVGVCWAAGGWDPARDIPLPLLAPLGRHASLVTLQRGQPSHGLLDPIDGSMDVVRTAALIASLDLVVTVDTMIAHLAGLLGCPVWVMLQRDADWRWMAGRTDSPWYPTARLFRQARQGDWSSVAAEVDATLGRLVSGASSGSFAGNPIDPQRFVGV